MVNATGSKKFFVKSYLNKILFSEIEPEVWEQTNNLQERERAMNSQYFGSGLGNIVKQRE